MEYERHVNRLVLGYLRTECKQAYNVFRKIKFPSHSKHLATRVAGQKLEDILKSYSRIQDIVLGHLENTNYYNEYGSEFLSPYYLAEQLLYLLDKHRSASPESTVDDRASQCVTSGRASRISCTSNERASEHGASISEDDERLSLYKTLAHNDAQNTSKPSILDKLSPSDKVEISSVLQKKLLEKTDFQNILVNTINSVLSSQDKLDPSYTSNNESNSGQEDAENVIKQAINRTESDPVFEELLQECLEPIGSTLEKATASVVTVPSSAGNNQNKSTGETYNNAAVTGILGVASKNTTVQCQPPQTQLQPQQFYIVNPPLVVPSLTPTVPRLTEHDIMTMPTLFINHKNEVTYAVEAPTTPYNKGNTVSNINEYVQMFGPSNPSPIITNPPKRLPVPIKPTPTVKVEIYNGARTDKATTSGNDFPTSAMEITKISATETGAQVKTKPTPEVIEDRSAPRSSGPAITPASLIIEERKPTPKSGSHVRNLQFPSPRKKSTGKKENTTDSLCKKQIEEVAKDLFKENVASEKVGSECEKEEEKNTPPPTSARKTQEAWDAHLRKNLLIELDNTTPPSRTAKRPTKRDSHKRKTTEDQLKTPKRPNRKKERRKLHPIDEHQEDDDTKKILSPSKLLSNNSATKRTMEVEDKETQQVATSNVRRNITNLLESPTTHAASDGANLQSTAMTAETPITSMLMANLKDIAGSSFAVETPDFPLTPGGCLLEQSTVTSNYYMLNDNEQNKVTEAIVLKEERSSSVRKTDDEEEAAYACREILKDFNKNQTGKKKLELLDQRGVQWEGDEEMESSVDEERNKTAVEVKSLKKTSGKCMTTLKLKLEADKAHPLRRKSPRFQTQTPPSDGARETKDEKTQPEGTRVAPAMTPSALSVKVELEKKRQRLIKLQKQDTQATTTPKRKSVKRRTTSKSKGKRASPKKVRGRSCGGGDDDNVDSQDEFFIKSGSNLHRTNIKNGSNAAEEPSAPPQQPPATVVDEDPNNTLDKSSWDECVLEQQADALHVVYDAKVASRKPRKHSETTSLDQKEFEFALPLADGSEQPVYLRATACTMVLEIEPAEGASSDSETKIGDQLKPPKKRKHRTDSCNSNSSTKKRKTASLLPNELINDRNIEKLLTKIHGPCEKT